MRPGTLLLLAGFVGLSPLAPAGGPARPAYGPAPPALAALAATPAEEALAAEAIVALEDRDPAVASSAARRLLLARHAGLRRAVERLGAGPVGDRALLLLLQVISASTHDAVDGVLATAAREPLPEARAIATVGLGAGRTGTAVEALSRLARDDAPSVRAAALRALYAIETPDAGAARRRLPRDADPDVETLRVRLQRLRGETGREAQGAALTAWLSGRSAPERLAGMRHLAAIGTEAPLPAIAAVVGELAAPPAMAEWVRERLNWPTHGYLETECRLAAAEAVVAWLRRPHVDPRDRDALLELGVGWLAHPVREHGRPQDEEARAHLFAALPDVGPALAEPVVRRLLRNDFEDPSHGVRLLVALPDEAALAALQRLVLAPQGLEPGVLAAVSGGFRDLLRIGDDATARFLLHPDRPRDVRVDGVAGLGRDDPARAIPLLADLVRQPDPAVASFAATTLEFRGGAREREILEETLLDATWRPFEQTVLEHLVAAADDAAYALLERAVREGPMELKEAVFQTIAHPKSSLRGPRALAIVRLAIDVPALRIDTGTIGKAIAAVDGPSAVAFIGARWRTWRSPRILVRNLQVSTGPEAREFALQLAATTPDGDEAMLKELATVLGGACEKAPERTDPFWRRLLSTRSEELRRVAVRHLGRVPHGPMSSLLVPLIADRTQDATLRTEALAACAGEERQPPAALLWAIASDRKEDDDLREACARVLLERRDPHVRAQALAWLAERLDEPSEAVVRIAELAGSGATTAQAADLLQLLHDELSARYESRPYFRVRAEGIDAQRGSRIAALVRGLGASGDDPSLDAMADLLFDPRFAAYSAEARRYEALRHPRGGGPLSALEDPPEIEILLHQAEEDPNDTPASPIPPEAAEIADALARRGAMESGRRVRGAIERAVATGRLAQFTDVYLLWLANRLRQGTPEGASPGAAPDTGGAAVVIEEALALTWPAASAEELVAAERRAQRLDEEEAWAEAAAVSSEAARLAARTGLADIPPARWLDRGLPPGVSWIFLRAQQDLLLGAAAAAGGKAEEAQDAFRRGVSRAPLDPRILRASARMKARTGFALATAEADALRAIALERRQGERPSGASLRALQRVQDRLGATAPPR